MHICTPALTPCIELSQWEGNTTGWRDAMFSGQDGISLSSIWEQQPQKGSGISLCCSHSVTTWTAEDIAFLMCCAWMNVIALQQALYITKNNRWWMRTRRAYMSRCVSLAWRLFGAAILPVALFKCSWNTRVPSPVTPTWARVTCISEALSVMWTQGDQFSSQRAELSH